MKRSHCDDDTDPPVAPRCFVLDETRRLILEKVVTKGVFHTYAFLFCVNESFRATMSQLIREHFKSKALRKSNSLMLHWHEPRLSLSGYDPFPDSTIRHFCTCLTELSLYQTPQVRGSTLKRMSNLTSLALDVENFMIEGRHIIALTQLTTLKLHGRHLVTSEEVAQMTQLRSLNLYGDKEIEGHALYTLTGLESLDLSGDNMIESYGLQNLGGRLTYLSLLSNEEIDDSGLTCLTSLRSLYLGGSGDFQVTNHGVSQLTQLEELWLQSITTVTGDALTGLTNLNALHLSYNDCITDDTLSRLTTLKSLYLSKNTTITDAGISTLTQLTKLNLSMESPIDRSMLSRLSNLTELINTV